MKETWKRLWALLACGALLCGTFAIAEEAPAEALSAPVEESVDEVEAELGDWGDAAIDGTGEDDEGIVQAAPVEQLPVQEGANLLLGTGLVPDEEGQEDGRMAVSAAAADAGNIGEDVHWTLDTDGVLTIYGTGEATWVPWSYVDGTYIRKVTVCEGVTALPDNCFNKQPELREVSLPSTLRGVGYGAFYGCDKLESVVMAGGEALGTFAFCNCGSLKTVELPRSLRIIGDSAFCNCAALATLVLPEGLESIGRSAFKGTALQDLTTPKSLLFIGRSAFEGVPLKRLTLTDGLREIDDSAFARVPTASLAVPGSVQRIGQCAFMGASIENLTLGEGVGTIEEGAFSSTKLTSLTVPGSVQQIGRGAFSVVPIESLTLGEGIGIIDESAFSSTKLTSLTVPGSVTTIGSYAFEGAPISSLTLGEGVQTLGKGAFSSTALEEVTLPASVREVDALAFYGSGARSVVVKGAPKLLAQAFSMSYYDSALQVEFKGGVPEFSEGAFSDTRVAVLYPGEDKAWAKLKKDDYGGDVTWVALKEDAVKDTERARTEKLKAEKANGYAASTMDNGDGTYTRVIPTGKGVAVEIYKKSTGKLTWKKTLKRELPLWGGFYGGKKYNFLVFGQDNASESDEREVVRVVRYTKNWNRVDAARVMGNNTVQPFWFGSLSMVESGDMLYLHTSHKMYKFSDGVNHQANFKVDIYVPNMQVTMVRGEVYNSSIGYVAHSFDQYIIEDGGDMVELDLGDAFPRAVAMFRRRRAAGSTVKSGIWGEGLSVMEIAGALGDNYTGVQLAGLEATKAYYITAGVSVSQKGKNPSGAQNVFVAAVPKDNYTEEGVQLRWLTKYKVKNNMSLESPRLVKINDGSLLLLWTENGSKTRYVFLNGSGEAVSSVYGTVNMVTQGQPMVSGKQVSWVYPDGTSFRMASVAAADALHAPELKAFKNTSKGISISWGKVEGATGYYLYRRTAGKKWTKVATVRGKTSWVDKKVRSGKQYYYTVKAYRGKDVSGYNDTGRPVPRLLAPRSVKVGKDLGLLSVSWKKVTGAEGYRVYRKTGGKWKLAQVMYSASSTSFVDYDVKPGKKYSYRVKAYKGEITSAYSAATKAMKP